ncbi:MAG: hypothetical protein EAZ36_00245 [Verrucomicrobia bacterium]|nr:MAG: hypothetical protein EAZ36_00245 [Verrucomicrobiota bacterium]
MATPSAENVAFVELTAHSLYIAVLKGRTLVAARAFSLDAKSDIASFVAEHQLSGSVRAAVLGPRNFLHRSSEAESGAIRQPAALQGHAGKLPHGLGGAPTAVVVDAATGAALDATRVSPWILAAVDAQAVARGRDTLAVFGLTPADVTLAATLHLGAVIGSINAGETALVIIPGDDDAQLAWVTTEGVRAVATARIGYGDIYEAVQRGLGLKFKAAAGKLFYNESYDFGDAAPKIAEPIADTLKGVLAERPADYIQIVGLIPAQNWLLAEISKVLGVKIWSTSGAAFAAKLGLSGDATALSAHSAAVVQLAAAGSADREWVQATLETLAVRHRATAVPFPSSRTASPLPAVEPAASPSKTVAPVVPSQVTAQASPPQPAAKKSPILAITGIAVVVLVAVFALRYLLAPEVHDEVPVIGAPANQPTSDVPPAGAPPQEPSASGLVAGRQSFENSRYRFEISETGVIENLVTAGGEALLESAAGFTLQGNYVGTDGRRKWFSVGGSDELDYKTTLRRSTNADDVTIFDVKLTHPRFEAEYSFRCFPDSVKVTVRFSAINMRDPRGTIVAVHSVRLAPQTLDSAVRMRTLSDRFSYTTKAGLLDILFDNRVWSRDGADGKRTIIAGENGLAFHFTDAASSERGSLSYEITIP